MDYNLVAMTDMLSLIIWALVFAACCIFTMLWVIVPIISSLTPVKALAAQWYRLHPIVMDWSWTS